MPERTTLYIKGQFFTKKYKFTLSDTSKITAQSGVVRLAKQRRPVLLPGRPIDFFPTDDDIFVRTRIFSPGALKTYDFVEAIGDLPKDENQQQVTSFAFRVFDGTDSLFWDGGAWATAGAGDWNTLADVNANLVSLAVKEVAFEIRLRTSDERFSPTLSEFKFRWTGLFVPSYKEWVYNAVVESMRDNIRPSTNFTMAGNGTANFDLSPAGTFDAGLNVVDVLAAYNYSTDPGRETDLLLSYDQNTKQGVLSAAVPEEESLWLVLSYAPTVAVTTSVDYVEDAQVPAIWITSIAPQSDQRRLRTTGPHIMDRSVDPPRATAFPRPTPIVNLDFTITLMASTSVDMVNLASAFSGWMELHTLLRSPMLDEYATLAPGSNLDWATANSDDSDTRMSNSSFALLDIEVPINEDASGASDTSGDSSGPVENVPGVKRINFNWLPSHGGDEQTTTDE